MKTISYKKITKKRPYFDKFGNWYFPDVIKFGGQLEPKLNPKEWLFLMLEISENTPEDFYLKILGSKSNIYRSKKTLKQKGYLL